MHARAARRGNDRPGALPPLLWSVKVSYRPPGPPDDRDPSAACRASEPVAPLGWPAEACCIAVNAALQAYVERERAGPSLRLPGPDRSGRVVRAMLVGTGAGIFLGPARRALERRRARQLGLTIETAPQPTTDILSKLACLLVWRAYVRVRGLKAERPWPYVIAQDVIGELDRRRGWRRALAAGR